MEQLDILKCNTLISMLGSEYSSAVTLRGGLHCRGSGNIKQLGKKQGIATNQYIQRMRQVAESPNQIPLKAVLREEP